MDKLPDVLAPGLKVVFCGTAAGERSAQRGCYYAGPGNKFWPTLADIGLTPRRLRPEEFRELPSYGLGLTDLAKKVSGADSILRSSDFDVEGFRRRLIEAAPRFIAFNGKRAAAAFLGGGRETCQSDLCRSGSAPRRPSCCHLHLAQPQAIGALLRGLTLPSASNDQDA
jgi:G:T/U-mismatch repair DNA glycosylase